VAYNVRWHYASCSDVCLLPIAIYARSYVGVIAIYSTVLLIVSHQVTILPHRLTNVTSLFGKIMNNTRQQPQLFSKFLICLLVYSAPKLFLACLGKLFILPL